MNKLAKRIFILVILILILTVIAKWLSVVGPPCYGPVSNGGLFVAFYNLLLPPIVFFSSIIAGHWLAENF